MSWYSNYNITLDPPRRCSQCSINIMNFFVEDKNNIKMILLSQPNKLNVLNHFLSVTRNKDFLYKILDTEILRVLK
nr:A3L protein [Wadden Sea poxvirus]